MLLQLNTVWIPLNVVYLIYCITVLYVLYNRIIPHHTMPHNAITLLYSSLYTNLLKLSPIILQTHKISCYTIQHTKCHYTQIIIPYSAISCSHHTIQLPYYCKCSILLTKLVFMKYAYITFIRKYLQWS